MILVEDDVYKNYPSQIEQYGEEFKWNKYKDRVQKKIQEQNKK